MKPQVFELDNDLRDRLGAALDAATTGRERAEAVLAVLFNPTTPLSEALLGMGNGGAPAVQIDNLPPQQEDFFTQALTAALRGDLRLPERPLNPLINTADTGFHQDAPYAPQDDQKIIRVLLCKEPGAEPTATGFETADEVIHAMACGEVGLALDTDPNEASRHTGYRSAHGRIVSELKAMTIFAEEFGAGSEQYGEPQPFLQDNPAFGKLPGAPQFFPCAGYYQYKEIAAIGPYPQAYKDFYTMSERLRPLVAEQSQASMRAHSAVFWNDAGILHDRTGDIQPDRSLLSSCARPDVVQPPRGDDALPVSASPSRRFAGGFGVAFKEKSDRPLAL